MRNFIADVRPSMHRIFGEALSDVPRKCTDAPHVGDPEANEALACSEYRAGKTVLRSLPPVLNFALTTHCYTGKDICLICDRNTRPAEADSSATEESIRAVTPMLRTAMRVLLHCGGEAMFSPHFDRVISMIRPPTRVAFATNGMALTERRADLMLEKDIMGGFVVSLDAATPETLRVMRPACDFDTICRNVAYYVKRARGLGREQSKIILNMTICESNLDDVPLLVDLAARLGAARVEYNHLNDGLSHTVQTVDGWDWSYAEQAQFADRSRHDQMMLEAYRRAKKEDVLISFIGKPFIGSERNSIDPAIVAELCGISNTAAKTSDGDLWKSPVHTPLRADLPMCAKPWREVMIQPTGLVRGCFFHDLGRHSIGNIIDTDFMQIWNSPMMVRSREEFLTGGVSKVCSASQLCVYRGRD